MGAAAGIIGAVLNSASQSGEKSNVGEGNAAGGNGNIANPNNQAPDIKTAEVEKAADTQSNAPQETEKPKASESETKDWSKLASMAQNLMSSGGQSQNMNFNATSQAQPVATFR